MKTVTTIQGCELRVESKGYPQPRKPIVGNLTVSGEEAKASFVEDDEAKVIYGERLSKPVFRGKRCSIWYNPKEQVFKVRITTALTEKGIVEAELNAEQCINYLKRKYHESK